MGRREGGGGGGGGGGEFLRDVKQKTQRKLDLFFGIKIHFFFVIGKQIKYFQIIYIL